MTIKVNLSNLNTADKAGALFAIKDENARRAAKAAAEPALAFGSNTEIVDSYEDILEASGLAQHESFVKHASDLSGPTFKTFREALGAATPEKREAAIAAATAALAD